MNVSETMYTTIPIYNTIIRNEKMFMHGVSGLADGIYFCNIRFYQKTLYLPSNAFTATVLMPSRAGYSNYSTQEKGVHWSMVTTSRGLGIKLSFFTAAVMYDILGRYYGGWERPVNGKTVSIPFKYYY